MDIRRFTPQTQQTLSKMDFNRDQQLSTRELSLLAKMPEVKGIDPKDLALIQDALKKSKGPEQIIVKLVDDDLLPGIKAPEPLFREKGAKPAKSEVAIKNKPLSAGSIPAQTSPTPATGSPSKKGSAKALEQSPVTFKTTPKTTTVSGTRPGEADREETTGADLQTTARFGALQLQGTTSVGDEGRSLGGKLSASYKPADDLGIEISVDGSPRNREKSADGEKSTSKAKSGSGSTGSASKTSGKGTKATARAVPLASEPTGTQLPENLTLNSKINAGPVKLGAKTKLTADGDPLKSLSTSAEVKVVQGHSLRAEAKPVGANGLSWNSVKLGSSHEIASGLSLTTTTQLGDAGKANQYGGGFKYDHGNGLNLEGELLTRSDTLFTRPAQTLQTMDLKFGFRYQREF